MSSCAPCVKAHSSSFPRFASTLLCGVKWDGFPNPSGRTGRVRKPDLPINPSVTDHKDFLRLSSTRHGDANKARRRALDTQNDDAFVRKSSIMAIRGDGNFEQPFHIEPVFFSLFDVYL